MDKKKLVFDLQIHAMENLDELAKRKAGVMNKITQAIKDDNEEAFQEAFEEYTQILQDAVMAEARGMVSAADNQILSGRGVRVLTSEETKYYQKLAEAMASSNPKQALAGFDAVLPETIIDAVFEDIIENHPLLSEISFENTGALIKYIYSTMDGRHLAWWGPLCSKIEKELSAQFDYLELEQTKLSAWLPVCKAMLDLGPAWLDRYVRTILAEAIANGLEKGIIEGRGIAKGAVQPADRIYEPIGMLRDLDNYDQTTGYAAKAAIPIAGFSPEVYGGLIAQMTTGPNNLYRTVTSVLLVCNPVDYFTKIMPATTYQRGDKTFVNDIFPFPTKVVQSAWVTQGQAVLGLPKKYFMAAGIGSEGRVEYSDEYKFLEDERTYLVKFYGNGRPVDNNCFLLLGINDLKPVYPVVRTTPLVEARLDGMVINDGVADLDISPTFDPDIHYYETATDAESGKITVTAKDTNATVTAKHNGTTKTLGQNWTWASGQNVVVITVINKGAEEKYILAVDCTYSAA